MTDLAQRLLASIENHGKSAMTGGYKLYPHEKKEAIDAAIIELERLGWVVHRKSMVIDGVKHDVPNVRRSTKQLYTQPGLLDG